MFRKSAPVSADQRSSQLGLTTDHIQQQQKTQAERQPQLQQAFLDSAAFQAVITQLQQLAQQLQAEFQSSPFASVAGELYPQSITVEAVRSTKIIALPYRIPMPPAINIQQLLYQQIVKETQKRARAEQQKAQQAADASLASFVPWAEEGKSGFLNGIYEAIDVLRASRLVYQKLAVASALSPKPAEVEQKIDAETQQQIDRIARHYNLFQQLLSFVNQMFAIHVKQADYRKDILTPTEGRGEIFCLNITQFIGNLPTQRCAENYLSQATLAQREQTFIRLTQQLWQIYQGDEWQQFAARQLRTQQDKLLQQWLTLEKQLEDQANAEHEEESKLAEQISGVSKAIASLITCQATGEASVLATCLQHQVTHSFAEQDTIKLRSGALMQQLQDGLAEFYGDARTYYFRSIPNGPPAAFIDQSTSDHWDTKNYQSLVSIVKLLRYYLAEHVDLVFAEAAVIHDESSPTAVENTIEQKRQAYHKLMQASANLTAAVYRAHFQQHKITQSLGMAQTSIKTIEGAAEFTASNTLGTRILHAIYMFLRRFCVIALTQGEVSLLFNRVSHCHQEFNTHQPLQTLSTGTGEDQRDSLVPL